MASIVAGRVQLFANDTCVDNQNNIAEWLQKDLTIQQSCIQVSVLRSLDRHITTAKPINIFFNLMSLKGK